MAIGHLERLRRAEIGVVQPWFKPGARVLEIGGGSGYQAKLLASWGCRVVSLDLPEAVAQPRRFYPVQAYDGQRLPVADRSCDVVFSSNVLEHIAPLAPMLRETRRVLKPGGHAIHILPSPTWRLWTMVSYYPFIVKCATKLGTNDHKPTDTVSLSSQMRERGLFGSLKAIVPRPHRASPNAPAELYGFSRRRWLREFTAHGFLLTFAGTTRLFYTGYVTLPGLQLRWRRRLSSVLGASSNVFVLRVDS